MNRSLLPAGLTIAVCVASCLDEMPGLFPGSEDNVPGRDVNIYVPAPYNLSVPGHFPAPAVPGDNPLTKEGVALGRRLYHDPLLSAGGPLSGLSCSGCHSQAFSFSNSATVGGRSVLPHVNLGWSANFLWDGKVQGRLEDITTFEVEAFFMTDTAALGSDPSYPELFRKAFGTGGITTRRCAYALAQWLRTLISGGSKYDRVYRKKEFLTGAELRGFDIFYSDKGGCYRCHGTILCTDNLFHNNGLDDVPDNGRYEVTGLLQDMGRFKTPTLRNVALTGPYMHDGRFSTLEEVVAFYSEGVKASPYTDPMMQHAATGGSNLSPEEKKDLIGFLHTLTDTSFTNNPGLASPF